MGASVTLAAVTPRPPAAVAGNEIDEVTLARARRGDAAAFRKVVERYERPVFSLLSRMLWGGGRAQSVEDLAQETFVRVFRGLPGFARDGRGNLGAWVLTIATHVGLDEVRRRPPEHVALPEGRGEIAAPDAADGALRRHTLGDAIGRAVAGLGPEFRATFLLREVHGLDYDEIAEATGVDLGTVKSRLSRARAALRTALLEVHDE